MLGILQRAAYLESVLNGNIGVLTTQLIVLLTEGYARYGDFVVVTAINHSLCGLDHRVQIGHVNPNLS